MNGFNIQMVDLQGQYQKIKEEIDKGLQEVLDSSYFIKGPVVQRFEKNLADTLDVKHVVSCGNGTDALQIALMSLKLPKNSEVILPAFSYAATAEVIFLLNLKPRYVDVNLDDFNINIKEIEAAININTKVILPVHLFGQQSDMSAIMQLAKQHDLYVIEDNAQSLATQDQNGKFVNGHISCTSFFPSKNLGCFGDGGAILTNNDSLAKSLRMIANHGQSKRYYHDIIGVNSRLDAIQAAVLHVKLSHLNDYILARQKVASNYDKALNNIDHIQIPIRNNNSNHSFHQYTLRILNGERDKLKEYLKECRIPSAVYYPLPLYRQEAYMDAALVSHGLNNSEQLSREVLSLPIHTELTNDEQVFISENIKNFFSGN